MPTAAETENNNLVLTALFKQIDVGGHGAIDFKRLATDMPVGNENAARHRWTRAKKCIAREAKDPDSPANIKNLNMVLTALFKQIPIGRVDFKRLAKDMGVNGENAARHRYARALASLGIRDSKDKNQVGDKDAESDGSMSSPGKVQANSKASRTQLSGSPLKNEILREGSELETSKKGRKRKIKDEDLTDQEQEVRMLEMPAKKLPKKMTMKKLKKGITLDADEIEEEILNGQDKDERSGSGFEDLDYSKVAEKMASSGKAEESSEDDWGY